MSRLALIALVATLLSAATGVEARLPGRLNVDLCVLYSQEECLVHEDKCTPCHSWNKMDVCMETAIAKRLPTKLFTCDFPPGPPEPDTDCQSFADEESCSAASSCVWCLSAAVPSACYTEAEAKRLPAAVFKCHFPSLAAQQ